MWVSLAVLALTYVFIIVGPFNHAIVALIAAVVVVIIGLVDQSEAIRGIDWNTIGLLAGMMILVSISRRSGLFQYVAVASAQQVRANPAGILLMLQLATALLSAVLNNVSTVLLMVPVTLVIAEELELARFPFLFAVKGSTVAAILNALERRLEAPPEDEFKEALAQVYQIASFRLRDVVHD